MSRRTKSRSLEARANAPESPVALVTQAPAARREVIVVLLVIAAATSLVYSNMGLIRFRGHLMKGVYGVRHGRRAEAPAAA